MVTDSEISDTIKKYYDASDDEVKRIITILNSQSYQRSDRDYDFIDSDIARPMRLQLEYLKVQSVLEKKNIQKTIVVFGGTRVTQKNRAELRHQTAEEALAKDPENEKLVYQLKVATRVLAKVKYYEEACLFASLVAKYSKNHAQTPIHVMTGGGPGVMEAANKGAYLEGEDSIGLNIDLPFEQFPNPYITPDLCFSFRYFALRKLHFMHRARALVAFPGGFGTFDELFEALTVIQTKTIKPIPIVLVGKHYWQNAVNFEFLAEEGVINREDLELFEIVETAQQAWDTILDWYDIKTDEI
ncbi:MAG TPA: LOG family protein [Oceanospirillales bacterium]|nr:LOG family protein [Oceanospirillales bacterium]